MAETLLEELKRYVAFSEADERALRALYPRAKGDFDRIATIFYDRILHHDGARKALRGGESQVGRLRVTLIEWMDRLLTGPWDEAYYEARARIGRVHVRIALPQHYMFAAMNVLRRELNNVIDREYIDDPPALALARHATHRILDLELAIMLHTYREDLLTQQSRTERLATFGQLVGSIGHELRNPLGVIETSLFILKGRAPQGDERVKKHLDRIGEQLGVANHIITNLLDMIRDRPLLKQRVKANDVLDAAIGAVTRPENVKLVVEREDNLEVDADPVQLRQVLVNLLENAFHAASPDGTVKVVGQDAGDSVRLSVEDTGPGVEPGTRQRLFEPLVTTKEKGLGLGLALVKRIIERHGGSIRYEDAVPHGARFVVLLAKAKGL